jgi:hypothetical protein
VPDPTGEVLTGWVAQPFHLVQEVVVELLSQRLERVLDVREVLHPTGAFTDWTLDVNLASERMPVEAIALVVLRDVGKSVSCLEGELFIDLHDVLI